MSKVATAMVRIVPPLIGVAFSFIMSSVAPVHYIFAEQIIYATLVLSTFYSSSIRQRIIKFQSFHLTASDVLILIVAALVSAFLAAIEVVSIPFLMTLIMAFIWRIQFVFLAAFFIQKGYLFTAALFQYSPILLFQIVFFAYFIIISPEEAAQASFVYILGVICLATLVMFTVIIRPIWRASSETIYGNVSVRLSVLLHQSGKRADVLLFSLLPNEISIPYLLSKRIFGVCDIIADYFRLLAERTIAAKAFMSFDHRQRRRSLLNFRYGVGLSCLISSALVFLYLSWVGSAHLSWYIPLLSAEFLGLTIFGPIGMVMNYHNLAHVRFWYMLFSQGAKIGLLFALVALHPEYKYILASTFLVIEISTMYALDKVVKFAAAKG
ncbi:hypothetical protein ACGYK4_16415 [Sulfitobacter sp. 1A13368]|uniref:hypothetical protein n=1 Tax=Sulfitobacter sp. 1A13368 TaxID=3368593 RepID=UPI003746C3CF